MTIRAGSLGALLLGIGFGTGCTHAGGKVPTDIPPMTYQAPDVDEITGIETPDPADESQTQAPAPAPAPAAKPAAPAKK